MARSKEINLPPWRFVMDIPIEIDGKLYKPSVKCYKRQTPHTNARYCLDLEEVRDGV